MIDIVVNNNLTISVEAAERMKKLPETVYIELRPRNGEAFAKVQSLAQNPRIKVNISIQRRLSSLIRMLERKWRPLNARKVLKILLKTEVHVFFISFHYVFQI